MQGSCKRTACVLETDLPTSWEHWSALVQTALEPGPAIPLEQLLLVRDLSGRLVRRFEPPEGVTARLAAVLLLLFPTGEDLSFLLTVRSNTLPNHRGEVSLPGGATDPEDASPIATALRECWEELGVAPDQITVWGSLTPIYIPPSNFRITPIVGFSAQPPELKPNTSEVSAVLTSTLRHLLDPATVVEESARRAGTRTLLCDRRPKGLGGDSDHPERVCGEAATRAPNTVSSRSWIASRLDIHDTLPSIFCIAIEEDLNDA
jgi:8-oxo-dGTP pyrophosphatase MutT (NUDIX family)